MPDDLQLKHERFSGEKVFEILGILHSDFRHGNPDDFEPDLIFKTALKLRALTLKTTRASVSKGT